MGRWPEGPRKKGVRAHLSPPRDYEEVALGSGMNKWLAATPPCPSPSSALRLPHSLHPVPVSNAFCDQKDFHQGFYQGLCGSD
jgi:hypothetical protein